MSSDPDEARREALIAILARLGIQMVIPYIFLVKYLCPAENYSWKPSPSLCCGYSLSFWKAFSFSSSHSFPSCISERTKANYMDSRSHNLAHRFRSEAYHKHIKASLIKTRSNEPMIQTSHHFINLYMPLDQFQELHHILPGYLPWRLHLLPLQLPRIIHTNIQEQSQHILIQPPRQLKHSLNLTLASLTNISNNNPNLLGQALKFQYLSTLINTTTWT